MFQLSQGPVYHVYSHYGCRSSEIDHCGTCKYLLQPNTYLHSSPQSLVAATKKRPVLPPIRPQLSPTPIKPVRYQIDQTNDLYILQDIPGSLQTRQEAEDAAIKNICLQDKSIDRIILVDADEYNNPQEDDVRYVRLYDVEKRSH